MSANGLSQLVFRLPSLPGSGARSYAKWPVWRDSVRSPLKCVPIPRLELTRRWHQLCRRITQLGGRFGGVLGGTLRSVYYALAFEFLNHRTGRCNPSYEAIATRAGVGRSTVARALAVLQQLGFVHWVRTCEPDERNGGFILRQTSNEYGLLPPSHWRGPAANAAHTGEAAPLPTPESWGQADKPPSSTLVVSAPLSPVDYERWLDERAGVPRTPLELLLPEEQAHQLLHEAALLETVPDSPAARQLARLRREAALRILDEFANSKPRLS